MNDLFSHLVPFGSNHSHSHINLKGFKDKEQPTEHHAQVVNNKWIGDNSQVNILDYFWCNTADTNKHNNNNFKKYPFEYFVIISNIIKKKNVKNSTSSTVPIPTPTPTTTTATTIATTDQIFQTLNELTIPLIKSQCVLHKHEILICGCYNQNSCYSYHKTKNEYNFILYNNKNSNQITLLSFGGHSKHTVGCKKN
ncbi:hypothetical protein RFI_37491 [Reticulomyxa filosa]|uniref:Uncharacterized protein n=1 Tax=Reticulomyxa filosa TaxID=46433 RepID=X6LDB1_RETFI|nr:hypothetical protein RFI_37491 [Reticulomyxa filosa]|eukprot:ETN99967.1 hypothetical protein RFI_37491 [Reticulomyxa filosa]